MLQTATSVIRASLAVMAFGASLAVAAPGARAQGYFVNGRDASPAEVQLLVSYGAQPGHWSVNGFGIVAAPEPDAGRQPIPEQAQSRCRYVLDVLLCE